jgi:hypothetical protein
MPRMTPQLLANVGLQMPAVGCSKSGYQQSKLSDQSLEYSAHLLHIHCIPHAVIVLVLIKGIFHRPETLL